MSGQHRGQWRGDAGSPPYQVRDGTQVAQVILFYSHVAQGVVIQARVSSRELGCGSRVGREDGFRNRSRRYVGMIEDERGGNRNQGKHPKEAHLQEMVDGGERHRGTRAQVHISARRTCLSGTLPRVLRSPQTEGVGTGEGVTMPSSTSFCLFC